MTEAQTDNPFEIADEVSVFAAASGLGVERVRELAAFAREKNRSLVEVLVEIGGADAQSLAEALAQRFGVACHLDPAHEIDPKVLAEISPKLAMNHQVIPLGHDNGSLLVACWDPLNWRSWDELSYLLDRPLIKVLSPRTVIDRLIKANYGIGADTVDSLVAGKDTQGVRVVGAGTTDLSEEEAANEPTVVNLVNKIMTEAIRSNATDIHFEPFERRYRIRYRIDGMLEDVSMPVSVHMLKLALVSRIKIMTNLDIAEKRMPQDGRCTVSLAGQDYDLRISILPGVHGEAVVIRLQSRQMTRLDLGSLGFSTGEQEKIHHLITRPHGLMLVTGPTGSGKTTTLYTCLNRIVSPQTKIITVEDPVEYWMDDILQMQVHEEIGFTFGRALRSMLRHDPDIMLVGEIRDEETAEIAIRSALTGHLVFATLHTNHAASAVTRLLDIGIEPFLAASSIQGVLAQRLIRRTCKHCRVEVDVSTLDDYSLRMLEEAGGEGVTLLRGEGCERCRFTGYRGRTAIGEVLVVTPEIRRLIQQRQPAEVIKEQARREGMITLRDSAMSAMRAGKTTLAEIMRVTQED